VLPHFLVFISPTPLLQTIRPGCKQLQGNVKQPRLPHRLGTVAVIQAFDPAGSAAYPSVAAEPARFLFPGPEALQTRADQLSVTFGGLGSAVLLIVLSQRAIVIPANEDARP
jgi:hypothetical protein